MKPRFGTTVALLATLAMFAAAAQPEGARAAASAPAMTAAGDHNESLALQNLQRRFIVHLPPGFTGKKKLAAVIMLHGAGGTGRGAMRQTGWDRKADAENFIAVFPDGVAPIRNVPGASS